MITMKIFPWNLRNICTKILIDNAGQLYVILKPDQYEMGTVDINNFIVVAQAPAILNGEKNEELRCMKIKKTYYVVSENNRTVK